MIRLLVLVLMLPFAALAQDLPVHQNLHVNDYADLLDPAAEARLTADLADLRATSGVEATVLTLADYTAHGPYEQIEPFATALFNAWGIGDATRNDGILILVARDNRAMRVELGAGYHQGYDVTAQDIVTSDFLPDFRDGSYQAGIERGTAAVIARIARPHAAGRPAPEPADSGSPLDFLAVPFIALVVLWIATRRWLGDALVRLRPCPACGRRGLRRSREVTRAATRTDSGAGVATTICVNCDYRDERGYSIARRGSSSSKGSFGGGRSSGGGASGRW